MRVSVALRPIPMTSKSVGKETGDRHFEIGEDGGRDDLVLLDILNGSGASNPDKTQFGIHLPNFLYAARKVLAYFLFRLTHGLAWGNYLHSKIGSYRNDVIVLGNLGKSVGENYGNVRDARGSRTKCKHRFRKYKACGLLRFPNKQRCRDFTFNSFMPVTSVTHNNQFSVA